MATIGKPKIDTRPAVAYIGIRTITPFRGMFTVVEGLRKELNAWIRANHVDPAGPPFLRYHVIDMLGPMDISYGVPVHNIIPAEGRVQPGELPAGRYASLIFTGGGLRANRTLIEWVRAQGLEFDRWDTGQGDNFRGRVERYLTDPRVEPRKSKWDIEVAIKLADK